MDAPELSLAPVERLASRPFWRRADPCVGIALTAAAGIVADDWFDLWPWTALGVFLLAALGWAFRPHNGLCLLAVAAGFAVVHAFNLHGVPAETLARLLPSLPTDSARPVRATGVVLDEPRFSGAGATARFTLGLERIELDGRSWPSHARVVASWKNGNPLAGDRLELIGAARNIAGPRNPGEFDFADYKRRQGIRSEIRCAGVTDVRVAERASQFGVRRLAARFHDWMEHSLTLGLDADTAPAAIISTMILGLREDPGLGEMEDLFQRTGTLHYFAIDGLKLALLSCLALWALERSGVSRGWARTLSLPPLVFYAMATGLGPASLRATVMAAILLGAFWLERPVRPLNSLGAAAAGILLFDTDALFDLGFQLTFLVVLAIIVLAGPLHRRLETIGAPDPFLPPRLFSRPRQWTEIARGWAWGIVSVSLVAWLGSLPIMILRFHVVSPVSPLANVVTFPLAWVVLALGVAALSAAAAGVIIPGGAMLAGAVNSINVLAAKLFLGAAQLFDAVPGGSFYVTAPSEWTFARAPAAELTVLDLGLPRAVHLRAGGTDWLIDAAQPFEYRRSIAPYLHARGVNWLDGMIFSQADTRHVGAGALVAAEFRPRRVIDSSLAPGRSARRQEVFRALDERKIKPEALTQGESIRLASGAELRALYPPPGLKTGASADRALVLQLRANAWRVLLIANGSAEVQRWLIANVPPDDLRSDALVTGAVPGAAWDDFLRAAEPRLVVSQTIGDAWPFRMMRTAESGAVHLRLWPDRIEVDGFTDGAHATLLRR